MLLFQVMQSSTVKGCGRVGQSPILTPSMLAFSYVILHLCLGGSMKATFSALLGGLVMAASAWSL